jgi:phage I-like protein
MKRNLLVAACAVALNLTPDQKYLVLVPEGNFRGLDGRPFEPTATNGWVLTAENGQRIVAALNQRTIDMVVDWEHATLKSKETGQEAPAAGWCKSGAFEYVAGVGICSNNWDWTPRATTQIESKEYRYLSPVFSYAKNGQIVDLLHASLTNTPNIDHLPEAILAAAAQDFLTQQESAMDLEELLEHLRWMLNLPTLATAAEIMAELKKAMAKIEAETGTAMAANTHTLFDAITALGNKLAANSQALPDPAKYVPIAVVNDLQTKVATLTAASAAGEVDQLITAACSDGRLLGDAHIAWARDLGKANPAALKAHLDAAPKIPALTTQQSTIAANSQQHQTPPQTKDDYEAQIAAQMGLA